jgi:hypothetical protein
MTVLEEWANPPWTDLAMVPAGAAGFPLVQPGDVETWQLEGGWPLLPSAVPGSFPPSQFRIFDLFDPSEIILVTATAGPDWLVTRGDGGTVPVAHRPGFAVHNVITGPGLAGLAQGVPSGNGLVLPAGGRAAVSPPGIANNGAWVKVASLPIPNLPMGTDLTPDQYEANPGAVYELLAWGHWWTGGPVQNVSVEFHWETIGAQVIGLNTWPITPPTWPTPPIGTAALPCQWRLHSLLQFYGTTPNATTANANTLVTFCTSNNSSVSPLEFMIGPPTAPPGGSNTTTTRAGEAQIWMRLDNNATGGGIRVQGQKAWRAG